MGIGGNMKGHVSNNFFFKKKKSISPPTWGQLWIAFMKSCFTWKTFRFCFVHSVVLETSANIEIFEHQDFWHRMAWVLNCDWLILECPSSTFLSVFTFSVHPCWPWQLKTIIDDTSWQSLQVTRRVDGQTDRRTDGQINNMTGWWTDRQTDWRTDKQTSPINLPYLPSWRWAYLHVCRPEFGSHTKHNECRRVWNKSPIHTVLQSLR